MGTDSLKITIVVDNEAADGFRSEHGLAISIATGNETIIFDSGQGEAFLDNLSRLGLSLNQITKLVLSHGHYDHTGAVKDIVDGADYLSVYAHPDFAKQRYSIHAGKEPKDISINGEQKDALEQLPKEQAFLAKEPLEITANVYTTGEIPRVNRYENTGGPFYLDANKSVKDLILDDQSVCIKTNLGIVVITGCCHSGIINTLDYVSQLFDENIHMVIGGLHLNSASDQRVKHTIDSFRKHNVKKIIPCHCTGIDVVNRLKRELGSLVTPGFAGMEIDL